MRISTRGRYAVRVMLDLALYSQEEYVKAKQIAKRQGISEKYLEQIIAVLNKAGFVRSVRGAQGGYCLAGSPEDYTVGQILRLTEGTLSPAPCLDDCADESGCADGGDAGTSGAGPVFCAGPVSCARKPFCEAADVWKQVAEAVSSVVDHVTIADLVRKHHENASKMDEGER
ncbi:MAG TPA: Rrf2 family transcriptional regulator [Candidatus Eisenbergiella stercoravium]|nr:Rrf2 family transcriptional regulator [Candidatus Eisenbergiella stercoravium]